MENYGEKITIQEGKQFIGLFSRIRIIGNKINIPFATHIKKILSDYADEYENKQDSK